MSDRIRVYLKKELRLDRLTFDQNTMYRLGTVAAKTVVKRVQSALDENDQRAKPLQKGYAIYKSKRNGGRAVRDLTLSGDMLRNFGVRTVSENAAYASNTTRLNQTKARANNKLQRWVVYSAQNVIDIMQYANNIFSQRLSSVVKEK